MHRIKVKSHPTGGHVVTNHKGQQFHAPSGKVVKQIHKRECAKLKQEIHNHEERRMRKTK